MLPGPNQIIACPHCKALAYYATLMSGNTFGARLYSDGKQIAPHMPEPPPFVECHGCHETYWLKDAAEVGTLPWHRAPEDECEPSWAHAPLVHSPGEERFYAAIEALSSDDAALEIHHLRMLAWHKRNDPYRESGGVTIEITPSARKNMEGLIMEITDKARQDKQISMAEGLTIIELLREQGRFGRALEMVEKNKWDSLQNYADQIAELCRQENNRVAVLAD